MTTIGIAAAKAQLSALVEKAQTEDVLITRNGVVVARLVWAGPDGPFKRTPYTEGMPLQNGDMLVIDHGELAIDHAFPPTTTGEARQGNGSPPQSTPAPRKAAPTHPSPPTPKLAPQAPGLTLADLLKAAR